MDSYLVRIYRRKEKNPRLLVGTLEEPGGKGKKAFTNLYELWEIINPLKTEKTKVKKRNKTKKT